MEDLDGLYDFLDNLAPARKVTQIAGSETLRALCNDGTMWELNSSNVWRELPPIPEKKCEE